MTEATNLPAQIERATQAKNAGGPGDLLAVAREAEQVKDLGRTLIASGLLPDHVKKPETALAIMIKGQELGIGPMYALSNITIISGKPGLSSELMSALVRRAGHEIRIIETTDERATVEGVRRTDPNNPVRITFTYKEAERAGLIKSGPWTKYLSTMLVHRAISKLCKLYFSECIMGGYTPEELGAQVNEDGEIVHMPATAPPSPEPAPTQDAQKSRRQSPGKQEQAVSNGKPSAQELRKLWQSIPQDERPGWDNEIWPLFQNDPEAAMSELQQIAEGEAGEGEAGEVEIVEEGHDSETAGEQATDSEGNGDS